MSQTRIQALAPDCAAESSGLLRLLFVPVLAGVLFGLFSPEPLQLPDLLPQIDKYGHFAGFLVLTGLAFRVLPRGHTRLWALLPLLALGLGSEVIQGALLPHRGGYSLGDMAANLGGITLAWLLLRFGPGRGCTNCATPRSTPRPAAGSPRSSVAATPLSGDRWCRPPFSATVNRVPRRP